MIPTLSDHPRLIAAATAKHRKAKPTDVVSPDLSRVIMIEGGLILAVLRDHDGETIGTYACDLGINVRGKFVDIATLPADTTRQLYQARSHQVVPDEVLRTLAVLTGSNVRALTYTIRSQAEADLAASADPSDFNDLVDSMADLRQWGILRARAEAGRLLAAYIDAQTQVVALVAQDVAASFAAVPEIMDTFEQAEEWAQTARDHRAGKLGPAKGV